MNLEEVKRYILMKWGAYHLRMIMQSKRLQLLIEVTSGALTLDNSLGSAGKTDGNVIHMGPNFTPVRFCQILAHELRHCHQQQPSVSRFSREEFVSLMLWYEVDAMLSEALVLEDLYASGCNLTESQKLLVHTSPESRYEKFSQWIKTSVTGTTRETYADYYGRHWDEVTDELKAC